MKRSCLAVGLGFAAALLAVRAPAQDTVTLKAVKYAELGQVVRQHLGKVVVVDLWATW